MDTAADLDAKWPLVLQFRPDFIKAFLVHSQEYAKRRDDKDYFGAKGLDPQVLALLVARTHEARLRLSVHVSSAQGYEASFLALVGDPLADWSSLGRIRYRFKDGLPLVLANSASEGPRQSNERVR